MGNLDILLKICTMFQSPRASKVLMDLLAIMVWVHGHAVHLSVLQEFSRALQNAQMWALLFSRISLGRTSRRKRPRRFLTVYVIYVSLAGH